MVNIASPLVKARRKALAFAFGLLYNQAARLYDPVSWLVSRGLWSTWQRTALAHLPAGGRVLDTGCGPGHLLGDLASGQYAPVGFDLSPAMLRLARRGLRRRRIPVPLCQGCAQALPFAPESFAGVISSFPTNYVYDVRWIREVGRVLQPGGCLTVVEQVSFPVRSPLSRCLEWLYQATGQRGPAPDLPELLAQTGLEARRETVQVNQSSVHLVIAVKE